MASSSRQPPLDYSRFNRRASGLPQYGSKEEAQEALKWAAMEAGLMAFPYGRAYKYGKSAYQAGLPGLAAQWASRKGSAAIPSRAPYSGFEDLKNTINYSGGYVGNKSLGKTVDDVFVKKTGYHGTEYPHFFERGSKGRKHESSLLFYFFF